MFAENSTDQTTKVKNFSDRRWYIAKWYAQTNDLTDRKFWNRNKKRHKPKTAASLLTKKHFQTKIRINRQRASINARSANSEAN